MASELVERLRAWADETNLASPSLLREAADALEALEKERDEFRSLLATQCGVTLALINLLTEAIQHADAIAWSEGMPPDKRCKRLGLREVNEHGAFQSEWNVAKAREFLEGIDVSRGDDQGGSVP